MSSLLSSVRISGTLCTTSCRRKTGRFLKNVTGIHYLREYYNVYAKKDLMVKNDTIARILDDLGS